MFYTQGTLYYILFGIVGALTAVWVTLIIKKFKGADYAKKLLPIKVLFGVLVVLEVIKIFWLISFGKSLSPGRYPLVFCSLVLYAYPLFCFKDNKFSEVGKAVAVIPSLIAGLVFLIYPVDLAPVAYYPALKYFIATHSMFFHLAMVGTAIYIVAVGIYKFEFRKYFECFLALAVYILGAATVSMFIGGDISLFGPNGGVLHFVYDMFGFVPGLVLVVGVVFLVILFLYKVIDLCQKRKSSKAS